MAVTVTKPTAEELKSVAKRMNADSIKKIFEKKALKKFSENKK